MIVALKLAALLMIKLIWFSDAPEASRADLMRAVPQGPAHSHVDQH